MVQRARIVLLSADGVMGREIAARVGCSEQTVVAWRARYAKGGLAGLEDRGRSGRPPTIDATKRSAWTRELRDHCLDAQVAFFFKQWGGCTPKSGGRTLDGRTWEEYPLRVGRG
jgi:transposase